MDAQHTTVRTRSAWWHWRHARPFWGGLFVTLAGIEILVVMKAPLPVVLHVGMQGLAGYLVPMVLLLCGILLIFSPAQRIFYSVIATALSLASWLTSNLGGFMLGLVLGLVGSALAFAWSPNRRPKGDKAPAAPPPAYETPSAVATWMAGSSPADGPATYPASAYPASGSAGGPAAFPGLPSTGNPPQDADAHGRHRLPGEPR